MTTISGERSAGSSAVDAATMPPSLAAAFGTATAVEGLAALRAAVDAPRALRDYGMPEDGIAKAVAPILAAVPANNPTPVTPENITALLRAAWEGEPA